MSRRDVTLYVAFDLVANFPLKEVGPIDVNGDIVIAKASNSARTMPVSDTPPPIYRGRGMRDAGLKIVILSSCVNLN